MKKSLLVVPALGVMLLAAAGSVGGTVAWFSSVSSVEASAGKFEAARADGNLSVQFAVASASDPIKLIDENDASKGIEVKDPNTGDQVEDVYKLTHASLDFSDKKIYTISSENSKGVREVSANTPTKANGTIFYAFTWTMTFSYEFAQETNVNLYFESTSADTTGDQVTGTGKLDAITGFRLAFVGESSTSGNPTTRIWAPRQTANNCKYVETDQLTVEAPQGQTLAKKNQDGFDYPSTPQNYLIDSGFSTTGKPSEGEVVTTDATSNAFLGQFHNPGAGNTSNLVFTCVAWFEGTDPNVARLTNAFTAIGAKLKFYTREANGAYPNA